MTLPSFRARYGPVALVGGASNGIGAAFAEGAAARGLEVLLVARRAEPLSALAARLRSAYGVRVTWIAADLGTDAGRTLICEAACGLEVGMLIHSAALAPVGAFLDRDAAEHSALVELNCRTPALFAHHFGRLMAARGRGGIILVSSLASLSGAARVAHYAASKAYERVLAEGLWEELRPRGVDVLGCLAGTTDTPTYHKGKPSGPVWPAVMEARVVAEQAFPRSAAGRDVSRMGNRVASLPTGRRLPVSVAVRLVSASTRKRYQ